MTRDDQARLNMAYQAWKAAAPTDEQVEAGAHRVAAALTRSPTRQRSPKLIPIAVGAVSLGAALAYAAAGPLPSFFRGERPVPSPAAAAKRPQRVVTLPSPPPKTLSAPLPQVPQGSVGPAETESAVSRSGSAQKRKARAPEESSWRRVDEALARGDERTARAALAELDTGATDDDTRAKSRLGLAQLALSRGSCDEARRFALGVQALTGASSKHHQRARGIIARCAKDGG